MQSVRQLIAKVAIATSLLGTAVASDVVGPASLDCGRNCAARPARSQAESRTAPAESGTSLDQDSKAPVHKDYVVNINSAFDAVRNLSASPAKKSDTPARSTKHVDTKKTK